MADSAFHSAIRTELLGGLTRWAFFANVAQELNNRQDPDFMDRVLEDTPALDALVDSVTAQDFTAVPDRAADWFATLWGDQRPDERFMDDAGSVIAAFSIEAIENAFVQQQVRNTLLAQESSDEMVN
jgi:hypothetical protein